MLDKFPKGFQLLINEIQRQRIDSGLPITPSESSQEAFAPISVHLPTEHESQQFSAIVANLVVDVDRVTHSTTLLTSTIALTGDLGSGKTYFATHFIRELLPSAEVSSPTFSLINPYQASDYSLYHLDLYRMQDVDELESIGFWDFSGIPGTLTLIEWMNLFPIALTPDALIIGFTDCGEGRTAFLYTCDSRLYQKLRIVL